MGFEVYNTTSQELLVRIENNEVYIAPNFQEPLKKIPTEACFPYHRPGEKEAKFGQIKAITRDDPRYPEALRMFCEAQLLTHPESYTTKKPVRATLRLPKNSS